MAEEFAPEDVPSGSFLRRATAIRQKYLEDQGSPKHTSTAEEQLRGRSVEDRVRLYHRSCLAHLSIASWPAELYLTAHLGRALHSDWTPYPTFGPYSVYFPDFYMNKVNLWEAGEFVASAGGAVLTWLNKYSTKLTKLEFDSRAAEQFSSLGRLLGA